MKPETTLSYLSELDNEGGRTIYMSSAKPEDISREGYIKRVTYQVTEAEAHGIESGEYVSFLFTVKNDVYKKLLLGKFSRIEGVVHNRIYNHVEREYLIELIKDLVLSIGLEEALIEDFAGKCCHSWKDTMNYARISMRRYFSKSNRKHILKNHDYDTREYVYEGVSVEDVINMSKNIKRDHKEFFSSVLDVIDDQLPKISEKLDKKYHEELCT